jgi:hypothetical protein
VDDGRIRHVQSCQPSQDAHDHTADANLAGRASALTARRLRCTPRQAAVSLPCKDFRQLLAFNILEDDRACSIGGEETVAVRCHMIAFDARQALDLSQ